MVAVAALPVVLTLKFSCTLIVPDISTVKPLPTLTPPKVSVDAIDDSSGESKKVTPVPSELTAKYLSATKLDGVSVRPKNVDNPLSPPSLGASTKVTPEPVEFIATYLFATNEVGVSDKLKKLVFARLPDTSSI